MAPISSKPADHELRLELEALNQALQHRSHTSRCSKTTSHSPALHAPSPKHPLQPKPSFKVPFRSASFISCDRSKAPASPSSTKPLHHQRHDRKGSSQHYQHPSAKKGTQNEKKPACPQHQHHDRKRFWRWRPFRAISHLIMSSQYCRLHVIFSLHVDRIEGLPAPMNGLRLTVRWICKDQGLQTIPSRIFHGIAEFGDQTLQQSCTVYGTRCPNGMIRYDAKPSTLSIVALDVDELELAKHHLDLSSFLVQNDESGNTWRHSMSYELSGMAKGSTLIVSFSYDLAPHNSMKGNDGMHPTTKQCKKTSIVTKNLGLSKQCQLPLIESDLSTLKDQGANAAACCDVKECELVKRHALQDFSAESGVLEASNLSDSGLSSSFEFKPDLQSILEDEHRDEFSFVQSVEVGPASVENLESSLYEVEGHLKSFPFCNTVSKCDKFSLKEDRGCKMRRHMQSDQWKLQETWGSGQDGSNIGQWMKEEAKVMEVLQTVSDDEVDRIAEEFLNMLGIN